MSGDGSVMSAKKATQPQGQFEFTITGSLAVLRTLTTLRRHTSYFVSIK